MYRRTDIESILCTVGMLTMLAGCSVKAPPTGTTVQKNDTTSAADSTSLVSAAQPAHPLSYEQRQGKFLYAKYCMVCHGEEGKGDGFNAFNLDPKPRNFTDSIYMSALSDEKLQQTIVGGGKSVKKSIVMPSWGGRLNKEEIGYVISYIRQFGSSK